MLVFKRNVKAVVAQAVVQGHAIAQLPFVLKIYTGGQPAVSPIVNYGDRSEGRLRRVTGQGRWPAAHGQGVTGRAGNELGTGGKDRGRCIEPFCVVGGEHPGAECVANAQLAGSVHLQAVGEIAVVNGGRVAAQEKALRQVGGKMDVSISGEGGSLI